MSAAGRLLALLLAVVVGDVLRVRRAHAEHAMRRAGIDDASRVARSMYRSLGRGLVELLALAVGRPVVVHLPAEAITALRGSGTGAVVATAHTGSWDVVACEVARHTPLTVVTKRLSVGLLDRLWQGLRRRRGVALVHVGGAAREVARALARGELVAMIVDQAPERSRSVVQVPFLGAPAWVDLAPALAAMRARAPLVAAFPLRSADGSHRVVVARTLIPPPRASRAWAVQAMGEVTRALEDFIREHPEQWLWMHRRWKDPRSPAASTSGSRGFLHGQVPAGIPGKP